jgi:hypothetical protein
MLIGEIYLFVVCGSRFRFGIEVDVREQEVSNVFGKHIRLLQSEPLKLKRYWY